MVIQESDELTYSGDNVIELVDIIENMFENKPPKRNKKIYKAWANKLNELIITCNKIAKHPLYSKVEV